MTAISAAGLVDAWERGATEHPERRALTMLRLIEPAAPGEALAALSLGERDRRLLDLRQRLAGSGFDATAGCPVCQQKLDIVFRAEDLPLAESSADTTVDVAVDGYAVRARVLSTSDLLAVVEQPTGESVRTRLLQRSILSIRHGENPVGDVTALPQHVTEQLETKLAAADPMSDLHVALSCPSCAHEWEMAFDVARYVWEEVADRAKRLLREVHTIAACYGWREQDILSMTDARRRAYLALIEGA